MLFAPLALVALIAGADAAQFIGKAQAIAGDVIVINGTPLRLYGIDAPEPDQTCNNTLVDYPCGQTVIGMLNLFLRGQEVVCDQRPLSAGIDPETHLMAVRCMVGGLDVSERLVRGGVALADRQWSEDYVAAEEIAQAAGFGLWAGEFVRPWDWRAGVRPAQPEQ